MIGIELGARWLKLARVKQGRVTALTAASLPDGLLAEGRITDPAAFAAFLRSVIRSQGIRDRRCALILPPQAVLCQHLTIPTGAKPDDLLAEGFREFLDRDPKDMVFDYIITKSREDGCTLYACALPKTTAQQYWSAFRQAGLHLCRAFPGEIAWQHLLAHSPAKCALWDPDNPTMGLCIFSGGNFIQRWELNPAAETVPEIHRAVNLYNYTLSAGESLLESVYLCGPWDGRADTIHPIRQLTGFDGIACGQDCTLAAGAAMMPGQDRNHRSINLVRHLSGFDPRRVAAAGAAVALALLLFAKFGILNPLSQKALAYENLSQKQLQLEELASRLEDFHRIEQQYLRYGTSLLTEAERSLAHRAGVLELVESQIPPGAAVDTLTISENHLTLRIRGLTLEDAGSMVSALKSSPLVNQAAIHSATAADGNQATMLISVTLAPAAEED